MLFMRQNKKINNQTKTLIGLSSNEIKKRIATHKTIIKCKPDDNNYHKYVNAIEMSKLVHKLKNQTNYMSFSGI